MTSRAAVIVVLGFVVAALSILHAPFWLEIGVFGVQLALFGFYFIDVASGQRR